MKDAIEQHRGMASRENKAIPVHPDRVFRIKPQQTLPENRPAGHWLTVLQPTTTIACGIAIDQFIVFSRIWYSQPVSVARYRREITDKEKCIISVITTSHKRHDTIIGIVQVNPGKPGGIVV